MPLRVRGSHRRQVDRKADREEHAERVEAHEDPYHPRHLRPLDETALDEHHHVPEQQVEAVRSWIESPRPSGEQ